MVECQRYLMCIGNFMNRVNASALPKFNSKYIASMVSRLIDASSVTRACEISMMS